jgi:hypothetical protein
MIKLDDVEINRKRTSHRGHYESFKKIFLNRQKKIDRKNNKIEKGSEKEV